MYTILPQWKTVAKFADVYISQRTGKPVSRERMYQLVKQEKESAGSTDIDVMEVDGVPFVKYRNAPTTSQQAAAASARRKSRV